VAAPLRAGGVAGGDMVAVHTENNTQFVIAYHGVLATGAIVLPLDPRGRSNGGRNYPPAAPGRSSPNQHCGRTSGYASTTSHL
jgi:acyl-CoA synthetase (AMP-forming)/AMP-acid ligase II